MYNDCINILTKSFEIKLELNSLVSVAAGYSSTGKTFMVKMLELLKEINTKSIIHSNIELDDILVCKTKNDIENILYKKGSIKGKTIFIDRYDYLHSSELNEFILSGNNRIVVMSHTFYKELRLNAESFILLNYNKEKRLFYTEKAIEHIGLEEEII